MKRKFLTLVLATIGLTQLAYADYVSHASIVVNVDQSECLTAGAEAAKVIGIDKTTITPKRTIVYGMNSEGYTLQMTCIKGDDIGYFIINGAHAEKRGELASKYWKELRTQLDKINATHK
ncbi:MAG: hypothetical protein DRG30_03205 [Epsilonproteobacteria bacterium]|nr:MAG: hypothetical protein DRG30_03205 [Campylobacterota bacterium]